MMENCKILLCLLGLTVSLPLLAAAPHDDFKFGAPDRIDFWADSSFSKIEGNFEKSGNSFTKFNSGNTYQIYDMNLGVRAELAPRFNMYAATRFASAESQTTSPGATKNKSNSAFSSGTVGTDFVMMSGSVLLIPDFSFTFPFEATERTANSKVAVGEGVMEGTGRLILRIERNWYRIGGFGGVTYRDGGRSMLVPYGALFEVTFGRWNFGADARGYQSVTYDKDTDREAVLETAYFCPVNGCSKKYGAFNPSKMSSNIWMRVNISREFALHVGGGMDWTGSNVSRDATFFGGLIYRWNTRDARRQSKAAQANYVSFEEDTFDGVDQDVFDNVPPKAADLPINGGAVKAPQRGKVRGKPRQRPKGSVINLQEELNKTEMQIDSDSYKQNED